MTAFWDIAPCSIIEVDRRFRGVYSLDHQGDDPVIGALSQKAVIFMLVAVAT
jgi:hypothetical protein